MLRFSSLNQRCQSDAFRSLDGKSEGAVPDHLGDGAKGAADAKDGGVELGVVEAVVVEKHAGCEVDVWVGILDLFFI